MNQLDNFYDEVSKVAYDLFEKRGKVHGHDMEDWLKSEIIVKKRYIIKNENETKLAKSQKKTKPVINKRE
jgi:Protein of unknown function (DUF2934)